MKIYYVSRKRLIVVLLCFLLLVLFTSAMLAIFLRGDESSVVSKLIDPIYQGNSGKKVVAICVNVDWGEEYIPQMLKGFEEKQAKVTFFVTGKWAQKNPELLREMKKAGHSIQNHGYQHLHFNKISAAEARVQIEKAGDIIDGLVDEKPGYFAPPYGEYNRQLLDVAAALDYELIMWSIDTIDWQRPEPATIVKRVISKLHNDAIILMHPTEPTVKALPEMLERIKEEGYKMVTINEIIRGNEGDNNCGD